jgi:hypothetical protein
LDLNQHFEFFYRDLPVNCSILEKVLQSVSFHLVIGTLFKKVSYSYLSWQKYPLSIISTKIQTWTATVCLNGSRCRWQKCLENWKDKDKHT